MKNSLKSLLVTGLAAVSFATIGSAQAQVKLDDINVVTVALKLQLQSAGYNSQNGTIRSFNSPVVQTVNTKNLLDRLALDKQAQGLYDSSKFPNGAKLAVAGDHFVVVKNDNTFIVDVSDIITFTAGANDIISGSTNNTTGLASPKITELVLVRLNFDDTFIVGGSDLRFFAQGLDTIKTQDSTPGNNGFYNENTSDSVKSAAGEGQSGGTPFVVTGSLNGSRNVKLNVQPPES